MELYSQTESLLISERIEHFHVELFDALESLYLVTLGLGSDCVGVDTLRRHLAGQGGLLLPTHAQGIAVDRLQGVGHVILVLLGTVV